MVQFSSASIVITYTPKSSGDRKMETIEARGASFREVVSGEREGARTYIVRAGRHYSTTPEDLWSALTDRERLQRWFAKVAGDFRQGGRFSMEGNADGDIVVCEPPGQLALTWEFGGNISWVNITIQQSDGGALSTLEHEHPTDPESQVHWDRYGPGAPGVGWELAMLGLEMHLSGEGASTIGAGEAWSVGAAGKATLRGWAEAWGRAHAETGTDPRIAEEAAKRTAAFYAGEEQ